MPKKLSKRGLNMPNSKPYKTHHEACQITGNGEINEKPSMTIEGEAKNIKKLLEQHKMGVPIERDNTGIYLDSQIEDIDHMHRRSLDLTDIQRHQESLLDRYEELEEHRKKLIEKKEEGEQNEPTETPNPENPKSQPEE